MLVVMSLVCPHCLLTGTQCSTVYRRVPRSGLPLILRLAAPHSPTSTSDTLIKQACRTDSTRPPAPPNPTMPNMALPGIIVSHIHLSIFTVFLQRFPISSCLLFPRLEFCGFHNQLLAVSTILNSNDISNQIQIPINQIKGDVWRTSPRSRSLPHLPSWPRRGFPLFIQISSLASPSPGSSTKRVTAATAHRVCWLQQRGFQPINSRLT